MGTTVNNQTQTVLNNWQTRCTHLAAEREEQEAVYQALRAEGVENRRIIRALEVRSFHARRASRKVQVKSQKLLATRKAEQKKIMMEAKHAYEKLCAENEELQGKVGASLRAQRTAEEELASLQRQRQTETDVHRLELQTTKKQLKVAEDEKEKAQNELQDTRLQLAARNAQIQELQDEQARQQASSKALADELAEQVFESRLSLEGAELQLGVARDSTEKIRGELQAAQERHQLELVARDQQLQDLQETQARERASSEARIAELIAEVQRQTSLQVRVARAATATVQAVSERHQDDCDFLVAVVEDVVAVQEKDGLKLEVERGNYRRDEEHLIETLGLERGRIIDLDQQRRDVWEALRARDAENMLVREQLAARDQQLAEMQQAFNTHIPLVDDSMVVEEPMEPAPEDEDEVDSPSPEADSCSSPLPTSGSACDSMHLGISEWYQGLPPRQPSRRAPTSPQVSTLLDAPPVDLPAQPESNSIMNVSGSQSDDVTSSADSQSGRDIESALDHDTSGPGESSILMIEGAAASYLRDVPLDMDMSNLWEFSPATEQPDQALGAGSEAPVDQAWSFSIDLGAESLPRLIDEEAHMDRSGGWEADAVDDEVRNTSGNEPNNLEMTALRRDLGITPEVLADPEASTDSIHLDAPFLPRIFDEEAQMDMSAGWEAEVGRDRDSANQEEAEEQGANLSIGLAAVDQHDTSISLTSTSLPLILEEEAFMDTTGKWDESAGPDGTVEDDEDKENIRTGRPASPHRSDIQHGSGPRSPLAPTHLNSSTSSISSVPLLANERSLLDVLAGWEAPEDAQALLDSFILDAPHQTLLLQEAPLGDVTMWDDASVIEAATAGADSSIEMDEVDQSFIQDEHPPSELSVLNEESSVREGPEDTPQIVSVCSLRPFFSC